MKVRKIYLIALAFWSMSVSATTVNVGLGAADLFAVLGGSTIINSGPSAINGNLGLWSGNVITGFPPGTVTGTTYAGNSTAMLAQNDLTSAYNLAAAQPCGGVLTGQNLGGQTLTAGVYCFASSAQLTGTLTLNAQGDSNAVFIFQVGSTLTTASGSSVVFINGGQGDSVFWQVGSSATLGSTSAFAGNILALSNITMGSGASLSCGRALALNGAVTLDTNNISIDTVGCESSAPLITPEPGTASLLSLGLLVGLVGYGRIWRRI